jgi:hypothetical protein
MSDRVGPAVSTRMTLDDIDAKYWKLEVVLSTTIL